MTRASRQLTVATALKVREEDYQGRKHLVVPIVALVEGVIHAMNAEHPELVTADEFTRAPQGWNGRPIFEGHPMKNGRPIFGNSPKLLEEQAIGTVFNAAIKKNKLTMEAWIDVEKAREVAPSLLERLEAGESVEISVGVLVETDQLAEGEHKGKRYQGEWHNIVPDHLALLPEDNEGACNWDMGCGVRAAQKPRNLVIRKKGARWCLYSKDGKQSLGCYDTKEGAERRERQVQYFKHLQGADMKEWNKRLIPRALVEQACPSCAAKMKDLNITHLKVGQLPAELLDGLCEHFGGEEGFRTRCMDSSLGDFDPDDQAAFCNWLKGECHGRATQQATLLARMMSWFRGTELGSNDLTMQLAEALSAKEGRGVYVESFKPESKVVVYSMMPEMGMPYTNELYQRGYTVEDDRVEVYDDKVEVTRKTEYVSKNAASGAPGSPNGNAPLPKEIDMTKQERVKALIAKGSKTFIAADQAILEAASDEQLARFEAVADKEVADQRAAEEKAVADKKAAEEKAVADKKLVDTTYKAPTFDEILATADPATRDAINEGKRVGEAKKAATIKSLKASGRCDHTDEQLNAMSQAELDRLVKLADVKVAVDFSAAGAPRPQETDKKEAPPAPDLMTALKAAKK